MSLFCLSLNWYCKNASCWLGMILNPKPYFNCHFANAYFGHNFGDKSDFENMKKLCFTAFDEGITHFDLANNYGPPYGSAESNFGKILKEELGDRVEQLRTGLVMEF